MGGSIEMAKKIITISVEEETLSEIDNLADKLGISRSAACNMLLNSVVTQDYKGFFSTLSEAVISKKKARNRKGVKTATV